tara:strand:+ start:1144 stop:1854 length:711 start_codon:yes stop_codon:yes gene_type:complete
MNKIICLWSCPRNISTALMYSFAQRKDTRVIDEPLYAHYLKQSGAKHPGREEVLNTLENNGNKVIEKVILQQSDKLLFHKLMTHFLIDINLDFLSDVINIIFIRNPKNIIYSYSKIIPNIEINDIGIKQQYELYLTLKKRKILPIVLNAKRLLDNPKMVLEKLCKLLEIPFDYKMLKWKKGGRIEDGVWAKYWYKNVHKSTGFNKCKKNKIKLNKYNIKLVKECIPFYDFLNEKSI